MSARTGVVPVVRGAIYFGVAIVLAAIVGIAIVASFGSGRVFTGLLVGALLFLVVAFALFWADAVVLDEQQITVRVPWAATELGWDRVLAARLANMPDGRWSLALDLTAGNEPYNELLLLAIPPVVRKVGNAYELRKREQVGEVLDLLRAKQVPMTVLPEIRMALADFWQIDLPVG
ncbi:hypothetical protein [Skermania piniformis]|uniref:PH domain-containing protein n=1 Tax=Skermania pinensis TaxID=39122 RepID=A0ABX8S5X8_9ACTN|nr:hypothetical protein [Skermania piniformis]QXQ13238.1 hypothetical protein KV203_15330 [Skermania piniformis]